jgi:hypothetical protein
MTRRRRRAPLDLEPETERVRETLVVRLTVALTERVRETLPVRVTETVPEPVAILDGTVGAVVFERVIVTEVV